MRQKYSFFVLMIPVLLLSVANSPNAKMWYVDDDSPCPGTGTIDDPFCEIQPAIDAASGADTVLVADGTYTGTGNKNLNFLGKAITVQSETGPDNTIIDCEGVGNAFNFLSGEGQDSVLSGFTIKNSVAAGGYAIRCHNNSSPTITNCTITGNGGGGVYCQDNSSPTIIDCTITSNGGSGIFPGTNSSPTITNCIITGNTAENGGGIHCYGSSPTITNCTIKENNTTGGATIHAAGNSSLTITGCTIGDNTAGFSGGIGVFDSSLTIKNTTISNNTGENGGGIGVFVSSVNVTNCTIADNTALYEGGGIVVGVNSSLIITNSILWGDSPDEINAVPSTTTVTFSDIQGGYAGEGNIDADPLFVGGGDYHLTVLSTCIDGGTNDVPELPDTDFEGDPRIVDGDSDGTAMVDMGADEYVFSDTDTDGLPDEWEMWYFGDLSQGPDDDYDEDGWTNVEEYFAGTDPTELTVFDNHRITVPDGREVVPSGTSYTIRWVAPPEAVSFKLRYSMDNGTTWKPIDSGITETSYDWPVPTPKKNKTKCLVKVIGYDGSDKKVGADKTDSTFTIEVVKLTWPNGGESLTSGDIPTITWTTHETKRDVAKVKLLYTKNGGKKWIPVHTFKGESPGSYDGWTVPDVPKTKSKCKVKVVLKDAKGNTVGSDTSDGSFTIEPAP